MPWDAHHFERLQNLLGQEWLEEGCRGLGVAVRRGLEQGTFTSALENNTHPIHKLWYEGVLERPLPSAMVIQGDNRIEHGLLSAHRILTLEFLVARLEASWSEEVRNNVAAKLRNHPEFESTLYELLVTLNLREAGHDVNLRLPAGASKADIEGTIWGREVHIGCKRLTFRSRPHANRIAHLNALAREMLPLIARWNPFVAVSLEIRGAVEFNAISEVVRGYTTQPDCRPCLFLPGPWLMYVSSATQGVVRLQGDLNQFDVLVTDGEFQNGIGHQRLWVVGIQDVIPSDWGTLVRNRLNDGRPQLQHGRSNIICLEVADMVYFTTEAEFDRVFAAVDQFLARDSTRVSAVIVTVAGARRVGTNDSVREGPVRFQSDGRAWVIRNPRAEVPLPEEFSALPFNKPSIWVEASRQPRGSQVGR